MKMALRNSNTGKTRRHLVGPSILALSLFGVLGAAHGQTAATVQPAATPAQTTQAAPSPFGPLKHVNAGLLDVAYAETGPADGPVVILLHGWPYDIHSYDEVAPLLAAKGYRVLMPYARGYGDTRFLSEKTLRNGQPAALASDVIDFMDALKIKQAVLGGYDWGARSADIVSALWPERVKALVSVSGYLIGNQAAGKNPLPPKAEFQWWYQFYFATDRGQAGYERNTHDFAKLIWQLASPKWAFDDATFDRSAKALDNPDPCRHHCVQLPLAPGAGRGRNPIRSAGAETGHGAVHQRADHYHGRRCQRCTAPCAGRLCQTFHRQIRVPADQRRHRP